MTAEIKTISVDKSSVETAASAWRRASRPGFWSAVLTAVFAAAAFALIAAAVITIDYFIQLAVMQPSLLKGETEGLSLLYGKASNIDSK